MVKASVTGRKNQNALEPDAQAALAKKKLKRYLMTEAKLFRTSYRESV